MTQQRTSVIPPVPKLNSHLLLILTVKPINIKAFFMLAFAEPFFIQSCQFCFFLNKFKGY